MKFEFKKVEFKKVIFTDCQIIIKKRKQNIVISLNKIDKLLYAKPSIRNYFSLCHCPYTVGVLYICVKEKMNIGNGIWQIFQNKKIFCIHIKYDNLKKIPKNFLEKIKFYDQNDTLSWK